MFSYVSLADVLIRHDQTENTGTCGLDMWTCGGQCEGGYEHNLSILFPRL